MMSNSAFKELYLYKVYMLIPFYTSIIDCSDDRNGNAIITMVKLASFPIRIDHGPW